MAQGLSGIPARASVAPDARGASQVARWLTLGALVLLAALFVFPMIWMVLSSFKTDQAIFSSPFALPESIDLSRWAEAWDVGNLGRYALNSAIVTRVSVTLILVMGAMAAFAFSRFRFPGRRLAMGLFALGLLLPPQAYFIAQSNLFTRLAITDTRWALIIPYTAMGLPLAVYLLKVFMDALPEELFDAAHIDGAGEGRVFRQLALPLLRPGLATVAIFSALAAWNEFLLALLYIQDDDLKTIPTGLLAFSSRYQTDYSLLFSALSIVTILMVVIYIVFNRHIVDGITAGSVK
jgi:raffinose/stachyose/melibiose transport system permease protein